MPRKKNKRKAIQLAKRKAQMPRGERRDAYERPPFPDNWSAFLEEQRRQERMTNMLTSAFFLSARQLGKSNAVKTYNEYLMQDMAKLEEKVMGAWIDEGHRIKGTK